MENVKIFCKHCGKEIWKDMGKDQQTWMSIRDAEITAICSDCILKQAKGELDE
jgi:hypothetical protein